MLGQPGDEALARAAARRDVGGHDVGLDRREIDVQPGQLAHPLGQGWARWLSSASRCDALVNATIPAAARMPS